MTTRVHFGSPSPLPQRGVQRVRREGPVARVAAPIARMHAWELANASPAERVSASTRPPSHTNMDATRRQCSAAPG